MPCMVDVEKIGRVGVLAGGPSSERRISLRSGRAVFEALKDTGCDTVFLDVNGNLHDMIKRSGISTAFIALHGKFGEDGTVQSILEAERIPYTGSGIAASRRAFDKRASKEAFVRHNILTPDYMIIEQGAAFHEKLGLLSLPLVIKPRCEGSSIGLSVIRKKGDIAGGIAKAFRYGSGAIVEEYIAGRELAVGILGDEPLPVIEIITRNRLYDFSAKYEDAYTRYVVPAALEAHMYQKAQQNGILAHRSLGCSSFSRVDMILSENRREVYVLEVNSIPGLTERSLLPKAAQAAGIGFQELCLRLVALARTKEMSKTN